MLRSADREKLFCLLLFLKPEVSQKLSQDGCMIVTVRRMAVLLSGLLRRIFLIAGNAEKIAYAGE